MSEQIKQHILSLSYGKDSLACLGAIEKLGLPLDRIVHAEVWATDTIPADLPPMVEFKKKADKIIKSRYGLTVEHITASREGKKLSYEKQFYTMRFNKKLNAECIYGFPMVRGAWCNSRLKMQPLNTLRKADFRETLLQNTNETKRLKILGETCRVSSPSEKTLVQQQIESKRLDTTGFSKSSLAQGADTNIVQYLGIAADEPERIERHTRPGIILPLVDISWDEAYCRKWCEENDLLSPIYTSAARGGCWFCHNQSIDQLRLLRKNYPEYWELLLKWDSDSPVTFHADGHTVHDFDRRFQMEDEGLIFPYDKFKWEMIDQEMNYRWF